MQLSDLEQDNFPCKLEEWTSNLADQLGHPQQTWGYARKAISLYLRDCIENFRIRKRFKLGNFELLLELPLDSYSMSFVRRECDRRDLVRRIKDLNCLTHADYQNAANTVAQRYRIRRYELDYVCWRNDTQ